MAYTVEVVVVEIKADFDPQGGEYTQVSFGYRLPIIMPPEIEKMYPPPPKPVFYKHALHLFIPRDKWYGQYTMWQRFKLTITDDGKISLKKIEGDDLE